MRKYTISPAIIDAMRREAVAARREASAQVPLFLPAYDAYTLPARAVPDFTAFDAEEARIDAGGLTVGTDEDDDFY